MSSSYLGSPDTWPSPGQGAGHLMFNPTIFAENWCRETIHFEVVREGDDYRDREFLSN